MRRRRSHEPARRNAKWVWIPILLGAAGCNSIEPVDTYRAETDPTALYMALTLEERAINLAIAPPYHTIQLVATPRDGRGEPMAGLPTPVFRLRDPGDTIRLRVTPEGFVTALAAGNQMGVIAELTAAGPVRHSDTALISVSALSPPPVLASLSIDHPISPDSAIWPLRGDATVWLAFVGMAPNLKLTPRAFDPTGQPISGLVIEYASLDSAFATVERWTGTVHPLRPGPVRMVARTTAYGVTKADTAPSTVSWPIEGFVQIRPGPTGVGIFEPDELYLLRNGVVTWPNRSNDSVDVTFDDPTNVDMAPAPICDLFQLFGAPEACGVGNMLLPGLSNPHPVLTSYASLRRFPVPGVYTYHSVRTGATGRIVVTDAVSAAAGTP